MRLTIPPFSLPPAAGLHDVEKYQELANRVAKIGSSTGKGSRWFEMRCEELRSHLSSKVKLEDFVTDRRDAKVVLHLWKTDAKWLEWRQPTIAGLKHLVSLRGPFRAAQLADLQEIYFRYFDGLDEHAALGRVVLTGLRKLNAKRLLSHHRKYRRFGDSIFAPDGPIQVAKAAVANDLPFEEHIKTLGLDKAVSGRYMHACKQAYYVETVNSLPVGEMHPVFNELVERATKESAYDSKLNVGQKVGQILIRKCGDRPDGMPQNWIQLVTDILGDPRRPKTAPSYQKWWAPMARNDEALMRRWLAGADLRLFLKILKDSSSDADLQRMYPARRKFLEGLLENHDIVDARLFLSEKACDLIRREYGKDALAAHGQLYERDKTVIYMNIENKLHFFEGTHNYKARGGGVMPDRHRVLSRTAVKFEYSEFTTQLERELKKAGKSVKPPLETFGRRHYPPISWQNNLIWEFEYYGVKVDPETVLTRSDYLKYRRKFGI